MHCSTTTNTTTTTLANPKMHSLKPFTFTLNLLLLLPFLSSQKPLVDADIEQVTLLDQSSLSLNNNNKNNSFASESDEEDILKRSCSIEADITASNFTYLMKFGVKRYEGDKGHIYLNATLDTGSDLIWFHSQPCVYLLGKFSLFLILDKLFDYLVFLRENACSHIFMFYKVSPSDQLSW